MEKTADYKTYLALASEPEISKIDASPAYWEVQLLDRLVRRYIRTKFWQSFIRKRLSAK